MANTLSANFDVTCSGVLTKTTEIDSVVANWRIGANNFDAITASLTQGTGNNQVDEVWLDERTLTAGANDDLDLSGTALQNPHGENIAFTKVKLFLIEIDAPDGTKSLRVGPQGVANAVQLWHGGVAAGNYDTVLQGMTQRHTYGGWTVTATTGDILRINNPGAGSVTYRILIVGLK